MSPAPLSPPTKMLQASKSLSSDSTSDAIRKRVCKACDRCRLKKSKCDGSHPCTRCKADNAICVFGERKKSHDKIYPKGYVEMLEQQQSQLVAGLQEMYKRLHGAQAWKSPALADNNGHPLTHDILAALNLLEGKQDGSGDVETFEEDCSRLQSKLVADGAGYTHRRGSISSDSDHSQQGQSSQAPSDTPVLPTQQLFADNFAFRSESASPVVRSPAPRPSYPSIQSSPLSNDPQFYEAEWAQSIQALNNNNPTQLLRSQWAMRSSELHDSYPPPALDAFLAQSIGMPPWGSSTQCYDYDNNMTNPGTFAPMQSSYDGSMQGLHDFAGTLDPMDVDFTKFVQVST